MDPEKRFVYVQTGSVEEVLRTSLPLIAASGSVMVKLFCDRAMLANYDQTAIEATLPAGLTVFMCMTFFIGLISYAQTFVAQYAGAGRETEAGAVVWQGIAIALFGGMLLATGPWWAGPLFACFNHPPAIQAAEVEYFTMLIPFSVFTLLSTACGGFWGGRSRTGFIMLIGLLTAAINVVGNWLFIFGNLGCPEMGIAGAALGTGLSEIIGAILFLVAFLRPANRARFGTWPRRCWRPALAGRLVRYGAPRGLHFLMDIASFNVFVLLMGVIAGRTGVTAGSPQEAANITFAINSVAFFILMGLGQGVSIMVGQAVGARRIDLARAVVRSSLRLALGYAALIALAFVLVPDLFLASFVRPRDAGQPATLALARTMLCFAAAWGVFDAIWIITMSALQGAGDTRFCMLVSSIMAWGGFVLPAGVVVYLAGHPGAMAWPVRPIWVLWSVLVLYVIYGSAIFAWRYRRGRWERMSVIDPAGSTSPEVVEGPPLTDW
jgi:MATE family multidrug resistance protein